MDHYHFQTPCSITRPTYADCISPRLPHWSAFDGRAFNTHFLSWAQEWFVLHATLILSTFSGWGNHNSTCEVFLKHSYRNKAAGSQLWQVPSRQPTKWAIMPCFKLFKQAVCAQPLGWPALQASRRPYLWKAIYSQLKRCRNLQKCNAALMLMHISKMKIMGGRNGAGERKTLKAHPYGNKRSS